MLKKLLLIFFILLIGNFAYSNEINTKFFDNFNDKYLTQYVNEALKSNPDIKIADKKVEQYRQQVKISFSNELPSLSVGANYLGLHLPDVAKFDYNQNGFVLPFIASYEADILLKNRDKTRSAKKNYEAAKYEQQAIYIALLSDVATSYINLIQYDYLIETQSKIVNISNEQLKRIQAKCKLGLIDSQTLNLTKQAYEEENNKYLNYQKQREIILNNFAILIGTNDTKSIHRSFFTNFEYKTTIPDTISSDIIFSRPDVKAAEKKLEAAKIDIRVARKELLPRFNITGIWAFNTLAEGTFFSWESSLASLMLGATQDIFKGGQKIANLKIKKYRYEELFEHYRKTDLNAVKEVNTALCITKRDKEINVNTLNQLDFEKNKFNNSNKKYTQGLISYPEYLSAERNLFLNKQTATNTKTQILIDYITLYKAVGGAL